jgi:hypothetical protein
MAHMIRLVYWRAVSWSSAGFCKMMGGAKRMITKGRFHGGQMREKAFSDPITTVGATGALASIAMCAAPEWARCNFPVRLRVPSGNIPNTFPDSTNCTAEVMAL